VALRLGPEARRLEPHSEKKTLPPGYLFSLAVALASSSSVEKGALAPSEHKRQVKNTDCTAHSKHSNDGSPERALIVNTVHVICPGFMASPIQRGK
jgi:hypothetical protein